MRWFGRRRRPVDIVVVPPCRACGSDDGEILDRHPVTIVPDTILASSTWPAERRERILAACPACGLVTDLGHPSVTGEAGPPVAATDGVRHPTALGRELVDRGRRLDDGAVVVDVFDATPSWRSALLDPSIDEVHWFSAGSLARTLRRAGFGVRALRILPSDRLQAEVIVDGAVSSTPFPVEERPAEVIAAIRYHVGRRTQLLDDQRHHIERDRSSGGVVAVWGASLATVAFLDALDEDDLVSAVVDPDPSFEGQRLIGRGLPIIGPEDPEVEPSLILVPDASQRDAAGAALGRGGRRPVVV